MLIAIDVVFFFKYLNFLLDYVKENKTFNVRWPDHGGHSLPLTVMLLYALALNSSLTSLRYSSFKETDVLQHLQLFFLSFRFINGVKLES